jgi:cytochrome d ubiquinol oxidase subunit I
MSTVTNDLARWQFATTSIYHFLFVPVTIGLAFLVAILQTAWHRNGKPEYRHLTRFFGTLLLINVAIGVVTGLVQEFEFGMNCRVTRGSSATCSGGRWRWRVWWRSSSSRRSSGCGYSAGTGCQSACTSPASCIWMVAIGSMLSAAFIMAANSWMQHPVGYALNKSGQPVLNNVGALFTNPTFTWGYVHVLLASLITGSLVMLAVSAWYVRKQHEVEAFRNTASLSLVVLIPTLVLIYIVLGAVDLVLMLRYSRKGFGHDEPPAGQAAGDQAGAGAVPALTY